MAGSIITCFSAGNSEYKDITLPTATATSPDRIVVRFQNANEYGETTIASPTYPKLRVYNSDNELLTTAHICDSTGHYAGQGCFDDDDIMEFFIVDDNNETLALIKNSDVREKTENYIIKSDNFIKQWGYFAHDNVEETKTVYYPIAFSDTSYSLQINTKIGTTPDSEPGSYKWLGYIEKYTDSFTKAMTKNNRLSGFDWLAQGWLS